MRKTCAREVYCLHPQTHKPPPTTPPPTPHTPPTPPTPPKAQTGCSRFVLVTFIRAFMMSTDVGVDTATAAARRRQRRLGSWLRHERMTVAMTLAEKLHHTSRGQKLARVGEEVVHDAHDAPRGPKTPPPGVRPGILPEPVPQRSDRTVRRFLGEAVDPSALSFLVRRAVEDRKREEEEKERKKKEAQEKADLELAKRDPAPEFPLRHPLRPSGRGRRGARGSSPSPLLVCGFDAVGKGSALALLFLVRSVPFC